VNGVFSRSAAMKVCTLTKSVSREAGGFFTSVRSLSQHLSKLPETTVEVIGVQDDHSSDDVIMWFPLEPRLHAPMGLRAFGFSPTLKQDLLNGDFDLIHTHGLWQYPSMAALNWHRQTGNPHMISPRGMLDAWALRSARWKKTVVSHIFEKAHLEEAACLHALNEFEAVSIRSLKLPGHICVIPNGIDLETNTGIQVESSFAKWRQTQCFGKKILLFLGRIHPKKGLVNLLQALAEIRRLPVERQLLEQWVLVIAGWDQDKHELDLMRLCTKLSIPWAKSLDSANQAQQVVFVGPQFGAAKTACYSQCDAFILPSFSEGLPMAILEAWSYEKPVLMTPECNIPEGFLSGAALPIETNPASIREALLDFFRLSDITVAAIGKKGRQLVESHYSWPKIAADMKSVYDWVVGGGATPSNVYLHSNRVFFLPAVSKAEISLVSPNKKSSDKKFFSDMRVLFVTPSVSRSIGGIFEIERRLAQCLSELPNTRVRVESLQDENSTQDLPTWKPLTPQCHPVLGPKIFGYSRSFSEAIMSREADIAHLHALWMYPSFVVNRWAGLRQRPYVITLNGMLDPWAVKNARWKKNIALLLYERNCLNNAACIHVNSEAEMKSARQFGLKNPILIIPNGVDLPATSSHLAQARNPRWINFIEPGRKILLYLSRIHPKKGLVNLLKAWAENRQSDGWVLCIAGWDQDGHEKELKKLAEELEIEWADIRIHKPEIGRQKSLLFLGPQFYEDKEASYAACDAFILPSFSEGLPMVILEAWAHGKPVLMTPECNLPEGFKSGAALQINPSLPGIQKGLCELFAATEGNLAIMGGKGQSLVQSKFTWPGVANELHTAYKWLLGSGAKPACLVEI